MAISKYGVKKALTSSFGGFGVAGLGALDKAKDAVESKVANPAARGSSGNQAKAQAQAGQYLLASDDYVTDPSIEENANAAAAARNASAAASRTAAAKTASDNARKVGTRNETRNLINQLLAFYEQNYGAIDELARDRNNQLDADYGRQIETATTNYTGAIPEIEKGYAAIGSGDSTDKSDAKDKAKAGFESTTATIRRNKEADQAKIGQYVSEQKAKWNADRDSALRLNSRLDSEDDLSNLNQARNDVESSLGSVQAERAQLGTDAGARGTLSSLTADAGRSDDVLSSLDAIIKGSMSNPLKQAAIAAVTDAGGLTEDDKRKVKAQYGDVYTAPVTA